MRSDRISVSRLIRTRVGWACTLASLVGTAGGFPFAGDGAGLTTLHRTQGKKTAS